MSTRSTIHIREDGRTLTSIYVHCEGNPKEVGLDTARALLLIEHYNGMGCLAASLVKRLKGADQSGGVCIFRPGQENGDLEYIYKVFIGKTSGKLKLRCKTASGYKVFCGTPEQWVAKYYGDEAVTVTHDCSGMSAGTMVDDGGGYFDNRCGW